LTQQFIEMSSMALNTISLAAAAKSKTQRAQAKVRAAETQLNAANKTFKRSGAKQDPKAIEAAVERTTIAEEQVHQAAEELDAVKELLDQTNITGPERALSTRGVSGQGTESLWAHLRNR
jgi:hypothetical protein